MTIYSLVEKVKFIRDIIRQRLLEYQATSFCPPESMPIYKANKREPDSCKPIVGMTNEELMYYMKNTNELVRAIGQKKSTLDPGGPERLKIFIDEISNRGLAKKISDSSYIAINNYKGENMIKMGPGYATWILTNILKNFSSDNIYIQQAEEGVANLGKDFIWDNAYDIKTMGLLPFFDKKSARYFLRIIKSKIGHLKWDKSLNNFINPLSENVPLKVGDQIEDMHVKFVRAIKKSVKISDTQFITHNVYTFSDKNNILYIYRSLKPIELEVGAFYIMGATVRKVFDELAYGIKNIKLTKSKKTFK